MKKIFFAASGLMLVVLVVDRLTKQLALHLPSKDDGVIRLLINQGLIFSLPVYKPINILVPAIIVFLLIILLLKFAIQDQASLVLPLTLIISGAVTNLIDRLTYGGVIDFIDIKVLPVFNLADVAIVVGMFWLFKATKKIT